MKFLMIFAILTSTAFAAESYTDCPAMNHSREKVIKDGTVRKVRNGSRVVRQ